MKQRLWIPDYLKGLAVLVMIQAHIAETWIRQDLLLTPIGGVVRQINHVPAAPLFMVLMGYLVWYTHAGSGRLFFRGLKVFFWGLLLNIGLNFHYLMKLVTGYFEGNLMHAILGVDILFLAGLSLMVISLIRRSKYRVEISLLAGFLVALTAPWIHKVLGEQFSDSFVAAFIGNGASWAYFPLFPWLGYSLAGYAFAGMMARSAVRRRVKQLGWYPLILLAPLGLSGFIMNWNDLLDLPAFYHHGLGVYIWSLSFILGISFFMSKLKKPPTGFFSGWISFLGRYLTRAYVVQWLIIGNLATFFYQQKGWAA